MLPSLNAKLVMGAVFGDGEVGGLGLFSLLDTVNATLLILLAEWQVVLR